MVVKASKRDFRGDLVDQIVKLIEEGQAPWQKPWKAGELKLPFNVVSGKRYRGGNSMNLLRLGYQDPRWCTYKQAAEKGWQVRKGEKSTVVEYWKKLNTRDAEGVDTTDKKTSKEHFVAFYANVFNAAQIDGIPPWEPQKMVWEVDEVAEHILEHCGVPMVHDTVDSAYYWPSRDTIHMPPRASFSSVMDYYEVAFHEVGHATGHESRLGRDLSGKFGTPSYAAEELRAQMCSLFLSAELGLPFNPERHAAYQASWVESLKNDKNEIFKASRDAEHMADYVLDLAPDNTLVRERVGQVQKSEASADAPPIGSPSPSDLVQGICMHEVDGHQVKCQVLIDVAAERLVAAQAWRGTRYEALQGEELADAAESFININEVQLAPFAFGLKPVADYPMWAMPQVQGVVNPPPMQEDESGLIRSEPVTAFTADGRSVLVRYESEPEFPDVVNIVTADAERLDLTGRIASWEAPAPQAKRELETRVPDAASPEMAR